MFSFIIWKASCNNRTRKKSNWLVSSYPKLEFYCSKYDHTCNDLFFSFWIFSEIPLFFFPIFLAPKFSSLNDKTITSTLYCKTNCRVSRISASHVHYGLKIGSRSHLHAPRESSSRIALHTHSFFQFASAGIRVIQALLKN